MKKFVKKVMAATAAVALSVQGAFAQSAYANPEIEAVVTDVTGQIGDVVLGTAAIIAAGLVIFGIMLFLKRGKTAAKSSTSG